MSAGAAELARALVVGGLTSSRRALHGLLLVGWLTLLASPMLAAPTLTVTSPADGALVATPTVDVSGTASDPDLASVTVNGLAASLSANSWLVRGVPLAEGSTTLLVRAENGAGEFTEVSRTVVLDSSDPVVTVSDPAPGTVVPGDTYLLRGSATDPHLLRVEVTTPTGTVTATVSDDVWERSVPLVEGNNTFTVVALDTLGHRGETTVALVRDSEAPSVQITAPEEGLRTAQATVDVAGIVDPELVDGTPTVSVTVGGVATPVQSDGSFALAGVTLNEGENRLTARATDALGNQGTHTRDVVLDTVAPTFAGSQPPSGALAVDVGARFEVDFDEAMAAPQAGSWRLESIDPDTGAVTPLASGGVVTDAQLVVAPVAELPSQREVRLVLTSGLTDLAGNALVTESAGETVLTITTADASAPPVPTVDPVPTFVCAASWSLAGTAETGSTVRVHGGASLAETLVGEDGAFTLAIDLAEGLNSLSITAADSAGNASPAVVVELTRDCQHPVVTSASLQGNGVAVTFSEQVTLASLSSRLWLEAGSGVLAGSVSLDSDGDMATFTASASLPGGPLRVVVAAGVEDPAGNALSSDYAQLLGAGTADSFVAGTALDAATGRPLAGVRVVATARDGAALADPKPEVTTGEDGRFLLSLPAGTHELTMAQEGFSPAFRRVTTAADGGVEVYAPRLTPVGATAAMGSGATTVGLAEGTGSALELPAGALPQGTTVSLTDLGEQDLPVPLPYGWSPRGAAWVDFGSSLASEATLDLTVTAPVGEVLELAGLDLATLTWRALPAAEVVDPTVSSTRTVQLRLPVGSEVAAVAAVAADGGPMAPPAAVAGAALGSGPTPLGGEVSAATLGFDPPVVLPTQRSQVQVDYAVDSPVASGAPLTLRVEETLETAGGSQPGAAFEVDLRLFHDATGEPGSRFWLQPSDLAASIALVSGEARVEVHPWVGTGSTGGVVDATGGTVTSAEGDRLEIPAGALAAPAAVTLARRTAGDLPLAPPTEGTVAGVLEVNLEGGELLLPARMAFASDPPPTVGARGLLLHVAEVLGTPRYQVVAEVEGTAQGWATTTIDPLDLPWPGLRQGGLYAVLVPSVDLGFARGTVLGLDGVTPAGGVVVEASLGAALGGPLVSWIQISSADGAYALAVPAAQALVLAASEPTSGDGVAVAEAAFATDERRDRDLALLPVGPEVFDLVPAPGAVDVPLGIEPVVTFTEAIDPASVDGEVELWVDGSPWPVDLAVEGSLVRLLPRASLPAATEVTLRVGLGVLDLQGHPTPNPVTATFTTAADSGSTEVDRRRIRLIAPDAAGQVQVLGLSGSVPAGSTVFVENQTSFSTTETVTAAQDGSFALSLAASLTDRLLLRAVLPDGEDVFLVLGPFLSADQRSALVGSEAVTFTTGDGVTVFVPAGAVVNPGWIRLALEPSTQRPVEMPTDLTALFDLAVDLGEVELRQPLEVELPAPGGLTDGPLLLMRSHEAFGRRGWMLHDLMRTEDSVLTTSAVGTLAALPSSTALTQGVTASKSGVVFPDAGMPRLLQPEQMEALSRRQSGAVRVLPAVPRRAARSAAVSSQRSVAGVDVKSGAVPSGLKYIGDVEALLQGVSHSGHYTGVESQVPLAYVQVPVGSGLNVVAFSDTFGSVPMMADSSIALSGQSITRLVLPSRLGESYTLEVRNLRSGYELFNQLMDPPSEEFVELSPTLLRDDDAPVVVDGSPLGFHLLQTFADGTWSVAPGVTLTVAGSSATLTGDVGAVDPEGAIRVVAIDGVGTSGTMVASLQGSFSLQFTTASGARHLLGLGGAVRSSSALELSFSEALGDDLSALRVERQRAGTNVWDGVVLDKTPVGSREVIRLQPSHGWQPGDYRLMVGAGLPDRMVPPNTTTWSLTLPFTVEGVTSIGGGVDVGPVRDLARLGSLLFVAGNNGVGIYDVSDPRQPQPYLPGNLQMPFPNQDAVRGLAVDTHGRVLAVGGGTQTFGQLRMLDVTALDRTAIASDPDARLAGWRGTSLVTEIGNNDTVPQLAAGTPRRVAVLPNEGVLAFAFDEEVPGGLTYTPSTPATGELAYRATLGSASLFAGPNQAVTLHNRSRGTWHRLDADGSGAFEFTLRVEPHPLAQGDALGAGTEPHLTVAPGERLELAIDRGGLAYVTVDGAGMAVVDLGSVYGESINTPNHPALSDVLAYVPPFQVDTSVPCDIGSPLVSGQPTDVGVLVDPDNPEPLVVPVLLERYGVALYRATDPQSPADLVALGQICGAVDGTARLTSMEVVQGYPLAVDSDGDGALDDATPRDLILATHGAGYVLAFDVTDRAAPVRLGHVQLPGSAAALSVDRTNRTLLVAGASGLAVVRLDEVWGELGVDVDQDGQDDRVVEWVTLGSEATGILASAELGLAWLGSNDVDDDGVTLRGLSLSAPEVNLVSAAPGIPQAVSRVAPLGVPTASPGGVTLPAWVRLQAVVPAAVSSSIGGGSGDLHGGALAFDLVSQGPGGLEIDGLSAVDGVTLPSTSLRDLALKRQGRHPWEQGYGLFVSDPVVLLADLRAMADYDRTALEDAVCRRCDVHSEGIYPGGGGALPANRWEELLSGHQLAARWPADLRVALSEIYTGAMLDAAEVTVDSVPWDLSPTPRQEPTLNPSLGTGDVAPGTLLHSGEFSHQVTDVAVPGRGGLDLAFTRTYRSQSLSDGPLGPGWDHAFRARLRPLPNGDVDFFDGRGRRETFEALPAGQFRPPAGRFMNLERLSQGWQLIDARANRLVFDRWGRLDSISDVLATGPDQGNVLKLRYDSSSRLVAVLDPLHHPEGPDRTTLLDYDDSGRLVAVQDFTGRAWSYSYDAQGRLTQVTTPGVEVLDESFTASTQGLASVYSYESGEGTSVAERFERRDNLTGCTDPKGQTWMTLQWNDADGDGRVAEVSEQLWGDGMVQLSYDFVGGGPVSTTTTVSDRRNHVHVYTHSVDGQATSYEDPTLALWNFTYDEQGLLTSHVEPLGRTTSFTWSTEPGRGRGNLLSKTVTADSRGANGSEETLVSEWVYEDRTHQVVRAVSPRGVVTEVERDSATGLATRIKRAVGTADESTTSIDFDEHYRRTGQPQRVTNPNGNITTYEYFPPGSASHGYLRKRVVDPEGLALTTRFETDARGNVTAVHDPRDVRHEVTYNALDWQIESRQATTGGISASPLGYVTQWRYDANGNLAERVLPFGVGDEVTRTRHVYGVLDELLESRQEVQPGDSEQDWLVSRYEYDTELNLVAAVDPEGLRTEIDYESRDLPLERRRGLGVDALPEPVVEQWFYNAEGQSLARIDGRSNTWSREYDGFGRLQSSEDPLGNRGEVSYDNHGNSVSQRSLDASGILLSESGRSFDWLDRPITQTRWLWEGAASDGERPAGAQPLEHLMSYDPASNLIRTEDPLGRITQLTYDNAERRVETVDAIGNRMELELDAAGNAVRVVTHEMDGSGQITLVEETSTFDALNRPVTRADGLGNTTSMSYDARNQVFLTTDAEGFFTTHFYDGLNRQVQTVQPEGIRIDYEYDRASRRTAYVDAKGQRTTWEYDAAHRMTAQTWADGTRRALSYDAAGNVVQITDPLGTVVDQNFDAANRMTSRQATLAAGVVGPFSETWTYDGLNRLVEGTSGSVSTQMGYDSLSRPLFETTLGQRVDYAYDAADNRTEMAYPSGKVFRRTFDALDRLSQVGPLDGQTFNSLAGFGYRGPWLRESVARGNGVGTVLNFDGVRRPIEMSTRLPTQEKLVEERLSFTPRGLKTAVTRGDANDRGWLLEHDGARRLGSMAFDVADPVSALGNNVVPSEAMLSGAAQRFDYDYDASQNLTESRLATPWSNETIELPDDGSGRNRPASVGGELLSWDANGNLTSKGNQTYAYDFRNRLTEVRTNGLPTVNYAYDVFGRRVSKSFANGLVEETAWAGWQEIELRVDGQLRRRNLLGAGLDEIVHFEYDLDGDGLIDNGLYPHYDHTGNVVGLSDASGSIAARYTTSPFGVEVERREDTLPPAVNQVVFDQGRLLIEVGEEISAETLELGALAGAIQISVPESSNQQNSTWTKTGGKLFLPFVVTLPVEEGQQARRRISVEITDPPTEGTEVTLELDPSAVEDLFANAMASQHSLTFSWPSAAASQVLEDSTFPEVETIVVRDGHVEVTFSERPDAAALAAALEIDGASISWTTSADGYTAVSATALDEGSHNLTIAPEDPLDLSGKGVAVPFNQTVTVDSEITVQRAYLRPDAAAVSPDPIVHRYSFHGRSKDEETGLYYFRHRYYVPELGRFTSVDPLGYVDGPSAYAFAVNSPENYDDPLGLAVYAFDGTNNEWDGPTSFTNVAKLCLAKRSIGETCEYMRGVGTGPAASPDGVPGQATGFGGKERLEAMYDALVENYNLGDNEIVIIGFSRGAALAREFANMVNERGIPDLSTKTTRYVHVRGRGVAQVTSYSRRWESPDIQFLGIFDTVGSFGIGGNDSNAGYDFSIPPNVLQTRHAVAANEYRYFFPLESIRTHPGDQLSASHVERYFRGAHSDVGGGYRFEDELSRIPLQWMWQEMRQANVPIGPLFAIDRNATPKARIHDSRWRNDKIKDFFTGRKNRPRNVFYHSRTQ